MAGSIQNPGIHYEPLLDEIYIDETPERPELFFMRGNRTHGRVLPRSIGIVQIVVGILLALLGICEVLIVPILEEHTQGIQLNKSTCYGIGLIAGLMMVITGSTAIRASLSKRKTTVRRFYNLTLLTLLVNLGLTVFLIVAYCLGWTTEESYVPGSKIHQVHMFVTIFTVLGLLFSLTAVVQYYDVVFGREVMLRDWWLHCLCGVCLGKVMNRQEVSYSQVTAVQRDYPGIQ